MVPRGKEAEFKSGREAVVGPLGSSFVVNAVLSRPLRLWTYIGYDAILALFMAVSEGGLLVKADRQTGVLRISVEQSTRNLGISGDGESQLKSQNQKNFARG